MMVFLRTLMRRWPLFLVVLVLAGSGTYAMVKRVGPTYETVASILIFPPDDADGPGPDPAGGNPYLALTGLTQARDIVIRTLTSKTVRSEVEESYPEMSFEATPDFTNSAPIVLFTVEAATPEDAQEALMDLVGRVPTTLADLQEGQALSERARITSVALTEDVEPTIVRKDQIRSGILVGAGTLGAGLLFIALVDGILAVRRRRREAAAEAAESAEITGETDDNPREAAAAPVGRRRILVAHLRRRRVAEQVETEPGPVTATETVVPVPVPLLDAVASTDVGVTQLEDQVDRQEQLEQDEAPGTHVDDGFPLTTAYLDALQEAEDGLPEDSSREDTPVRLETEDPAEDTAEDSEDSHEESDEDTDEDSDGSDDADTDEPAAAAGAAAVTAAVTGVPAPRTGAARFETRLVSVVEIRRARDRSTAEAAVSPSSRQREGRGAR